MKYFTLMLGAAALLAGCNQTAPVTSTPTTTTPEAATAPATPARADSATAAADAPPTDATATTPEAATPTLTEAETMQASFSFKPTPNPDDPSHPRTSAHLVLKGRKPLDIDLGKFVGKPDVVDAAKAKAANFPAGMLMGFRSYSAATGTSSDLAVLNEKGHLRIVQRRVEETAPEAGVFETAREVPLPANTMVAVTPSGAKK